MPPYCVCGHEYDEHNLGRFFQACQVDDCDCDDYEADPDAPKE
jgi:hypothetical protein